MKTLIRNVKLFDGTAQTEFSVCPYFIYISDIFICNATLTIV